MTNSVATCGIVLANAIAVVSLATAKIDPILEYVQNGASVAAVMGLFLWREMRRSERYEHLYDEERKKRSVAENKCSTCVFVRKANEAFLDGKSSASKSSDD